MTRIHEVRSRFYDELMDLCDKYNIHFICKWSWLIDRRTGETTSMQITPRKVDAPSR